jgi:hypothetical protein
MSTAPSAIEIGTSRSTSTSLVGSRIDGHRFGPERDPPGGCDLEANVVNVHTRNLAAGLRPGRGVSSEYAFRCCGLIA